MSAPVFRLNSSRTYLWPIFRVLSSSDANILANFETPSNIINEEPIKEYRALELTLHERKLEISLAVNLIIFSGDTGMGLRDI